MEEKIFTFKEVAQYLKIPKSTLYKLSQKGKIPSFKVGKQLRFKKSSLDRWLTDKENQFKNLAPEPLMVRGNQQILAKKPKSVLLIDDDQLVLKTLANLLKNYGYDVEPAESGEEALEKIGGINFDLLITDIRMPGIDGIETIRRVRKNNTEFNRSPTQEIIITGYIDSEAERQAQRLGITDYLYKPFAVTELIKTIRQKLGSAEDLN